MFSTKPKISVPENEHTPLIDTLLEFIQWQEQRISHLEDEIQDLKKETKKRWWGISVNRVYFTNEIL